MTGEGGFARPTPEASMTGKGGFARPTPEASMKGKGGFAPPSPAESPPSVFSARRSRKGRLRGDLRMKARPAQPRPSANPPGAVPLSLFDG